MCPLQNGSHQRSLLHLGAGRSQVCLPERQCLVLSGLCCFQSAENLLSGILSSPPASASSEVNSGGHRVPLGNSVEPGTTWASTLPGVQLRTVFVHSIQRLSFVKCQYTKSKSFTKQRGYHKTQTTQRSPMTGFWPILHAGMHSTDRAAAHQIGGKRT